MDDIDNDNASLRLLGVSGGVWAVPPDPQGPHVVLQQWQVYELASGSRHLVGWCAARGEGRVSSAVVKFIPQTRRCHMASGRIYELRGEPGWNGDAQYVLARWRETFAVLVCREVTDEVVQAIARAAAPNGEGA